MASLRVLTFNFHEPYLCLLAKTGHDFTVGLYRQPPFARTWETRFRPIPANVTLVDEPEWRRDLETGKFDVVIAHNAKNVYSISELLLRSRTPALFVCHNRRTFIESLIEPPREKGLIAHAELLAQVRCVASFVYISESKRDDYGIHGIVIPPGIDVDEYGGYTGEIAEALRVGNAMRSRNLMFDVDFQEKICDGIPNRVIGDNPDIPSSRPSASFDDLLDKYRSLRCLLHVSRSGFEDGYNLAMLEAMACGMPVVSLANRTSPLTDGVDGFVSYDADTLRERIKALLADRDMARAIGAKGRETVATKFPLSAFVANWNAAIEEAAVHSPRRGAGLFRVPRLKILMESMSSPFTTARYIEQALRLKHRVVSAGFRLPEALMAHWGFSLPAPEYPAHEIDLPLDSSYRLLLSKLPTGFQPDLFVWVDWGIKSVSPDIDEVAVPKICYMIDTHLVADKRIEIARQFDFTFLAQRAQVKEFADAGVQNVSWLPLGCSPELHNVGEHERLFDIAYCGKPAEGEGERRPRLLALLKERFPNNRIVQCWPHEMALAYAQSKIVVNACVNRDVNMRVFEAMASGALLITDPADGLEELFEDGKHLVVYRNDDNLVEFIQFYLDNASERQRIAEEGRRFVLAHHTYEKRVEKMLHDVLDGIGFYGGISGESRFHFGGYYRSQRREMLPFVPEHTERVLDVGCGGGEFGRLLKKRGAKKVVGLEIVERAWSMAKRVLDDAVLGNIEVIDLPFEDASFDCVCFTDVLEHLTDPTAALKKVARVLDPAGVVAISLPNARFFQVVAMLAQGRWEYQDAGILDRTHLRFFTATDARLMLEQAGYVVTHLAPLSGMAPEQLPRAKDGSVRIGKITIHDVSDNDYQELLMYQMVIVAMKPSPALLTKAKQAIDEKRYAEAYQWAEHAEGSDPFDRAMTMARCAASLGKTDVAESLYRTALSHAPSNSEAAGNLGILLVALSRSSDAIPLIERALVSEPNNDRYMAALGLALLAQERLSEALDMLTHSLELNFDNEAVLSHALTLAERLDTRQKVEPVFRRYVEFFAGNLGMACRFAEWLRALGRTDEACDRLETLLLLSPGHEHATALLASIRGQSP